jgi:hypothetical protein
MLEQKAAGKEIVSAETEEPKPTKAPDLMAALEESLNAVRGEEAKTDAEGNGGAKAKPKSKKSTSKAKSGSKSASNGRKTKSKSSGGRKKAKAGSK